MDSDWKYRYWLNPEYEDCELSLFKIADTLPSGVVWHEGLLINTSDGFSYRVALVHGCFDQKRVYIHLEDFADISRGPITEQERERWLSLGWEIDWDSSPD